MSPLLIEIGIHYHVTGSQAGDYMQNTPRENAPAIVDGIHAMLDAGLLMELSPDAGRKYGPTDGLRMWIDALEAVPWPARRWTFPAPEPPPDRDHVL